VLPAVLSVSNLRKQYGGTVAVDNLSFTVGRNEIVGLLGPNGAGKTTTINMILGVLEPDSGTVRIEDLDLAKSRSQALERTNFVAVYSPLPGNLTVVENLRFFGGIYGVPPDTIDERIRFALSMAGWQDRETALVSTLAGGWKQRLALGCAILHKPAVLFLDEPTSGVDPSSRRRFWNLIHSLSADGVSVLVSTHYMDEAEYCMRIAMIERGRLIALGTTHDMKQQSIGGELIELECENIGDAMGLAAKVPGVRDVAVFGNALHVLVDNAEQTAAAVCASLAEHGMQGAHARPIAPTMEDMFVHLVRAARVQDSGART
jgi:ABC-2 type transport system ATP-binding protein